MWILNQKLLDYQRHYLRLGTLGYVSSGEEDIVECEVIELVNP